MIDKIKDNIYFHESTYFKNGESRVVNAHDFEYSFNRLIKVLKPQYVSDVVSEVIKLINGSTTGSSTLTYLGSY